MYKNKAERGTQTEVGGLEGEEQRPKKARAAQRESGP